MSLFRLKINFTKCHFLIGCLNPNDPFKGIKDKVGGEPLLTPMKEMILQQISELRSGLLFFKKQLIKEFQGKIVVFRPPYFFPFVTAMPEL